LGKLLELFEEFAEHAKDGSGGGEEQRKREQEQQAQSQAALAQMEALKLELEETKGKMANIEKELAAQQTTEKAEKSLGPLLSEFKQMLQEHQEGSSGNDEDAEEEVALVQYRAEVGQLELEIEKLKVKTLKMEVLEEKVEASELAARTREKELLVLLEEKDRAISTLEQVVGDQEKFVSEMRRVEIEAATKEESRDGLLIDVEAQLMSARATIAEVEAEKLALERTVTDLQEKEAKEKEEGVGEERDPLLPAPELKTEATPAATTTTTVELVDQETISQQEKLINSLQEQVKEQENSLAHFEKANSPMLQSHADLEAEATRNAKMDQQVAKIRQLEIEMSQMATVQESDELARELTEAKMTVHQLQQELELVRLSALNPTIESSAPAPAAPAAALPKEKKKKTTTSDVPKSKSNGHDSGLLKNGFFKRSIPGQFVLKKKYFVPKHVMNGNSNKQKKSSGAFMLKKKEFIPKPWPRGESSFVRDPKGSFVLRKKEFAPKQISPNGELLAKTTNEFVLKRKEFTPKQLPRTAQQPFVRNPKGTFVLQKKQFAPKQISVSVKVSRTSAVSSKDPVFFSEESLK
jgi:hypothetical protein